MDTPSLQRLPLNALRVFAAVARTQSMAAAAEALHVSPSAVSMQIKALGEHLGGVALLRREGRGLVLTAAGEQLLPGVLQGLALLERAGAQRRRRAGPAGALTISVLPSFLQQWLMPRLPDLEARHPGLELHLHSSREPVDLAARGMAAAIRMGPGRWRGCRAQFLMQDALLPVAAPQVAPRLWLQPGQLPARQPPALLHCSTVPWSLWSAAVPAGSGGLAVDDLMSVLAAALEGRGLALVRLSLVSELLRQGRLRALGAPIPNPWALWWVTPRDGDPARREPLRQLHGWLREQTAAWQTSLPPEWRMHAP